MGQAPPPRRTAPTGSDADGESVHQERSTAQNCAIVALLVLLVEITGLTYTMVTPALSEIAAACRSPDISWIATAACGAIALAGALLIGPLRRRR